MKPPVGTRIEFSDAWGIQRHKGKVVPVETGPNHLCADDDRGVRFYIHVKQLTPASILTAMGILPTGDRHGTV